MNRPVPLDSLLHNTVNDTLEQLLLQTKRLQRLEQRLLTCLGFEAAAHCRLLNYREAKIILGVDSSAWASRLRYQLPTLLACARQVKGLSALQGIVLTVLPPDNTTKQTVERASMRLSDDSANSLRECARHIDHEGLRSALERLSRRTIREN